MFRVINSNESRKGGNLTSMGKKYTKNLGRKTLK
jgi:hypothetical protein